MKKFYITTPIYYPSAKLHIGHAYTTIAGDVLSRYKKKKGYEVYYLTGTDEHGQKIETVANDNNEEPKVYVDGIVEEIKKVWSSLNIEYDRFIRTTDEDHMNVVEKIFSKLLENDDIYLGEYEGLYCKSDEAYYTKTQVQNNKCPDCGKNLELIKEESYFFRCSKYVDRLLKHFEENDDFLLPQSRVNELINNFIKPGLDDLAVSRTSFKWGIPVKENDKHVIYVWIDALSNYISSLGYNTENDELFKKFWPADVQLLGKEIIRFHAIYWPMILMALDLPLPKKLFAHGWLLMENDKMSKSKGNVIYPDFLIDNYGEDSLRYYLMREVPFGSDGQFTPTSFINRFNNDLVNDLSNLVNRTISMSNKYLDGKVRFNTYSNINYENHNQILIDNIEVFEKNIEELNYSKSLDALWKIVSHTNKMVDLEQPWILGKDVKENSLELNKILWTLLNTINIVGNMLEAFMPKTAKQIQENLGLLRIDTLENFIDIHIDEYTVSSNPKIIFSRLDQNKEVEKISNKMKEDLKNIVPCGTIKYDEFIKTNLKPGLIKNCIKHSNSDNLYILKVQTDIEEKQIISGLVNDYMPEDLINKTVLIVDNMEPVNIRGELSKGMILTTVEGDKNKVIEINSTLDAKIK